MRLLSDRLWSTRAPLRLGAAALAVLGLAACSEGASQKAAAPASTPAASAQVADFAGTPARVRRMSPDQYANTIHYIFGDDIRVGAALTPLPRTDGLMSSGAASVGMTVGEIQQLQSIAATISAQVLDKGNPGEIAPRRDYLVPCKPANPAAADDACAAKFIKQTGRLLYRRALPSATITSLVADANRGATNLKDFYAGLGTVLEGMLIDPNVLMIADTTEADPNHPGKRRLDGYSVAARLSFFLWNAAPDEALLTAAEKGELHSAKGRAKVVAAMMASPRVEGGLRAFFDDMFGFEEFIGLAKDPATYPMVTGQTLIDAREQTLRTVVDHLLVKNQDYRDLYTTRATFMSPALAPVYQVVQPSLGWVAYQFPEGSPRVGLLSQVSFLALHSHPARASATKRGKALRELLLCQKVPAPPANVDFSAVENPDPRLRTARQRLDFHSQNPVCAGCHKITDPMGLALENFDGAGRFRATEKGEKLDVSGTLDGKQFTDVAGLGQALHDHAALPSCVVRRMYSYGTGGPLSRSDDPAIKALTDAFTQAGYKVPELMRMIATSEAFLEIVERQPTPSRTAGMTSQSDVKVN